MIEKVRTMRVTDAGYYFTGHYCFAPLRVVLVDVSGCSVVEVNPKEFLKSFDTRELFKVFDIDPEDGTSLQEIEGEYCRARFDENGKVVALQHLTKDNIIWYVEGEGK